MSQRSGFNHLLTCCLLASEPLWALDEPIQLHYYERPPYMLAQGDQKISGLTASVVDAVFKQARIPVRWVLTPAKRQLWLIEQNTGFDCGIGWYKSLPRQQFAQFSLPIYRDQPSVMIVRNDFAAQGNTMATLLANPKGRLLLKDGLTYGSYIASQLKNSKARSQIVTQESATMVKMLEANRADLMFASREEAEYLLQSDRWPSGDDGSDQLHIVALNDITQGEDRHLMCSQRISVETMTAINAAILQVRSRRLSR